MKALWKAPLENFVCQGRYRVLDIGNAKRREFKFYSQIKIGGNVQINHMVRTLNGYTYRIFIACDKKSKWVYAELSLKLKDTFPINSI